MLKSARNLISASLLSSVALGGLYIVNPTELKNSFGGQGEITSKLSNVGYNYFQKGTSRIGQVITPFQKDGQGCQPLSWDDFTPEEMAHFEKSEGFFLMLQRGGCTFQQKMRNAAEFGAEIVIISDYKEEDWAQKEANQYDGSKLDGTLMTHIPAFEINWEDAYKMVEYIHAGDQIVYLKATFDVTKEDNSVHVDLWYSTVLDLGMNLATELTAMSMSFEADHAYKPLFEPRIATYQCPNCDKEFKEANCFYDGMYCGYTPNFYKYYDLEEAGVTMTGKEILMQGLREKCLYSLMSTKYKDEGDLWWTFFSYLGKCFAEGKPETMPKSFDECFDWSTVMINGNEEVGFVDDCVEGMFEERGDHTTDNVILRTDRQWANANQVKLHPIVAINNITYTNSTGQDLALSICAAYREAPDECELAWKLATFGTDDQYDGLMTPHERDDLYERAQASLPQNEGEKIFGSWHLYLIIGVIVAINLGVLFFLRYRMKRQMSDQMHTSVNAAVTQYFALSGQE